jgi:hypothetical protein
MLGRFEQKKELFEKNKLKSASILSLKILENEPKIPQITPKTRRFLKLKSLFYILKEDHKNLVGRYILKKPFHYGVNFLKSLLKKESYNRIGDAFLYGLDDLEEWKEKLKNKQALLVVGFSYCHKPLECPSGRFTSACKSQSADPVCSQCLIHKYKLLAEIPQTITFVIPTIHYIGEKILKIKKNYPDREIIFLISACEMTLKMFGDWGNMASIKGIGIRLGGRICNTMRAFILSEQGIKPGLTTVSESADQIITESLSLWDKTQAGVDF